MRPAKLHQVSVSSPRREVAFPAVVRATELAELTFQVPGQVVQLDALEGQLVVAGHVIARLDQRDARNNLEQAQAQFSNAEAELQRAERLIEQEAISQSALDGRRTQLKVARAKLAVARKAVDDAVLRAPFEGAISRVFVERYQNVQAKEPVVTLQSSTIEAVISAPSALVARSAQLNPVGTRVELDVAPGLKLPATFREASGVADAATQTYQLSFTFTAPKGLLILPGMTAMLRSNFTFTGAEQLAPSGVTVPLGAILAEGDELYVWLMGAGASGLSKRRVTLGNYTGDAVVVTSGLEAGDVVVAAGVRYVHEGMQVEAWTDRQ